LTRDAAAGTRDVYDLDECGFAPTLPTAYTWARTGTRVVVPYEAPQGRRVNVIGALSRGETPRRLVWSSRQSSHGKLDSAAFLDFICRDVAELPTTWATLPPDYVRERPCTIILDNYSVHHSRAVQAAEPALARAGITFYFLPSYSPELSQIEPVWHQVKYGDLTQRSFATAAALQDAVEDALAKRAATFQLTTHDFPRAA
jgi:hypothetical protein